VHTLLHITFRGPAFQRLFLKGGLTTFKRYGRVVT